MDQENRHWWTFPRWTDKYEKGLDDYVKTALATEAQGNEIRCPCKNCCYRYWYQENTVKDHVIAKGFVPSSEQLDSRMNDHDADYCDRLNDDIDGLLRDSFPEGPNEEATKFYKLVEESQQELYPGCKDFSKLSFTIRLFVFKRDHKLSNAAFDDLLELLKALQPHANIPSSFTEANTMLKVLGLDYIRIDACRNDCMLFWEEHANETRCHVCKTSRWKSKTNDETTKKHHQVPAKVLRYFPIKKRLQRLYMCSETAQYMTWHTSGRKDDGLIRHPADGKSWKSFDLRFQEFSKEPRNVRLALATDGFSPFNTMSITHSTWPVMLINYNLPPWMCMKPEFIMLTLLIPGPFSPGNDIDIYLQPLIKDLKELWDSGIETYDSSRDKMFNMRVALLSTISDFPGYAMLSGWSTKGKTACPNCHYETCSQYLKHSKKMCYMGHRRFLDRYHPYRRCKRQFNGKVEDKVAPTRLLGIEVFELLSNYQNKFGKDIKKKKKKRLDDNPWRKRSIFFDLPYWKYVLCPHSLDVMHVEKNIFDNIVGTLLNISGKTKDHMKARMDLVELNIMHELQPKESEDGKRIQIAKSRFWMTEEEKRTFCHVIKSAKLPQGCSGNISRCVQVDDKNISGYKSHDAHFMMQYLLPIAVRSTLHKDVAVPLMRLSAFFKGICNKAIKSEDLDKLQLEITETLCQFERIFPPSFFDVMVHLPIHLVEEIKNGGSVLTRWMYAIERYLRKLKLYVRNKGRPEGSMAEAYIAEECVTFCARYLHVDVKDRCDKLKTKSCDGAEIDQNPPIFPKMGHPISGRGRKKKNKEEHGEYNIDLATLAQAHRYVIFNCNNEDVEKYISEHNAIVTSRQKRKWSSAQRHGRDFTDWFREKVEEELGLGHVLPDHIRWLSVGPSFIAKRYTGYFVNGYRFHTMKRDANCLTENSGVTLTALTQSFASSKDQNPITGDVTYYGSIKEIIEIHYHDKCTVVLFKCLWFHAEKDEYGLTRVNVKKLVSEEEPFILATQAQQVFYVDDPNNEGWRYVIHNLPTDNSIENDDMNDDSGDPGLLDVNSSVCEKILGIDPEDEITRVRVDVPATVIDKETMIVELERDLNDRPLMA